MDHLQITRWRPRLDAAATDEELLRVVRAYLQSWRPEDVIQLPVTLTAPIRSIEELHVRTMQVLHQEPQFRGSEAKWQRFSGLAAVITAAAVRARELEVELARAGGGGWRRV